MKKINHIATVGCSHSSDMVGKSWPIFLKEHLNCNHTIAFSSGAGNEMNLEKVKFLVDKNPDLLIVQLTDPARFTMALSHRKKINWPDGAETKEYLTGSHVYNSQLYYTFNTRKNDENLINLTGDMVNVDHFFINYVLLSDYNLYYKICHTISIMAFLAEKKNIPIVFFSWNVDIHAFIHICGYAEIFKDLKIIPGFVENFAQEKGLLTIPDGRFGTGHHGPDNQKIIMEEYILPYLTDNNFI